MKHKLAFFNQKGGVGKTTTAINLAAYLAISGKRVLICDIDPQGNATSGLGIDKNSLDTTLYDVLFSRSEALKAIKKTNITGLDLLPANGQLKRDTSHRCATVLRRKRRKSRSTLRYRAMVCSENPSAPQSSK